VQTDRGRAVIRLAERYVVSLGPETALSLGGDTDQGWTVSLEQGQLLAVVSADRGPTRFTVQTRAGEVRVLGTIFAVDAGLDQVQVSVLRGQVEVAGRDRAGKRLIAGTTATVGRGQVRALDAAQEEPLWQQVRLAELVSADQLSQLEIQSSPPGVEVRLDHVVLGLTPIAVSPRSGQHQLALVAKGETVLREELHLGPGQSVKRMIDLAALQRAGPPVSGDAGVDSGALHAAEGYLSAAELVDRAQTLASQKKWTRAARSYSQLIQRFPKRKEARTSLVSLGLIYLDRLGRPAHALTLFERYLALSGRQALDQEALEGKVRALRRLGRTAAEKKAIVQFLERFPFALGAQKMKKRLAELDS
jgi:hypothetical protein